MKELIRQARKGNKESFEEIVNRTYKKLYVIAKARLANDEKTESARYGNGWLPIKDNVAIKNALEN